MKFTIRERRNWAIFKKQLKVFFDIGGNTLQLIVSLISSIFWIWLSFGFIKFALMSIFGLYGAMNGDYSLALLSIREHSQVWNTLAWGIALIHIIFNVQLYGFKKQQ
jgi:hypothetical protein